MEGKVFDGVISSQMRFKKRLFSSETLESGKKMMLAKFSPKNFAQTQGMIKRNHEIFGVFQNLG